MLYMYNISVVPLVVSHSSDTLDDRRVLWRGFVVGMTDGYPPLSCRTWFKNVFTEASRVYRRRARGG